MGGSRNDEREREARTDEKKTDRKGITEKTCMGTFFRSAANLNIE